MVERANEEVFRHLTPMINDKKSKDDFAKLLPFAQRISVVLGVPREKIDFCSFVSLATIFHM